MKISQNVQNLGFFEKIDGFFEQKNVFFFKIGKGGKFAVECDQMVLFRKKSPFGPNHELSFGEKNQKILKVGKIRK